MSPAYVHSQAVSGLRRPLPSRIQLHRSFRLFPRTQVPLRLQAQLQVPLRLHAQLQVPLRLQAQLKVPFRLQIQQLLRTLWLFLRHR